MGETTCETPEEREKIEAHFTCTGKGFDPSFPELSRYTAVACQEPGIVKIPVPV
jgi:hypothetical protein